jgi:GTP-binding protein
MDKLFKADATFFWGAQIPGDLPEAALPEVAFAGRSNVGKSSLINAVLDRKHLVRTSSTPGQTRALNFFNIGDRFTLVDMPGYGFAKASKVDQKNWQKLLKTYLRGRVTLRLVCLLIDARHGIKDTDKDMLKLLAEAAVPVRVVLTKSDETESPKAAKAVIEKMAPALRKHPAAHPVPILTSSHKLDGIDELRHAIAETLGLIAPE